MGGDHGRSSINAGATGGGGHRLCRLLGLGLLAVDLRLGAATVVCGPVLYRRRPNLPQHRRLLKEHGRRKGDPATGGSLRRPMTTAYLQRALVCAAAIGEGAARPRDLKHSAEDAGAILPRNVYGWFERVGKGTYRLMDAGRTALKASVQVLTRTGA